MKKVDFNKGWLLQKNGSAKTQEVNLPHDAMLAEERNKDVLTGGASAYFDGGKYYYRKKLVLPEEWRNKTMILSCEGVYQNAQVSVNNQVITKWPYGYSGFYVDMTEHLSQTDENIIEIIADNEKVPNSRWYSGGGVYREVNLLIAGQSYIKPEGVRVTTTGNGQVQVLTDIVGEGDVEVEILDGMKAVASGTGRKLDLIIKDPVLWDEENPHLYTCKVMLKEKEQKIDEETIRFGIRTLAWSGKGFFVNGKETLLRGACIHHDNGILGACGFKDAEYRRIKILKEAGFNAIRSSHNPVSKAMLDACDELGIYVMDELCDYWLIHKNPYDHAGDTFLQWWKKDVDAMIGKDYNHPSVIMYSIGNEISELGTLEGQKLCKEISDYVRRADETRTVTCGINLMLASMAAKGSGIYGEKKNGKENKNGSMAMDSMPTSALYNVLMNKMGGVIDKMASKPAADKVCDIIDPFLDIPGYNYATSRYEKEAQNHPERCIVGSETLPLSLYKNWQLVKKCANLIGDFMWTGWDYLGETGLGTIRYVKKETGENIYPGLAILAGCGVIDICGMQRPETGWNRIIWGLQDKPVIAVDPVINGKYKRASSMWRNTDAVESWSWEGCEGCKTNVTVYTSAPKAELYCNGKRIASAKVKECKAVFKRIEYVPGTLSAIVYDENGKEIDRAELFSAIGKTMIQLACDKQKIRSNGQDLCFIEVSLIGENGIIKASADQMLTVQVEGSGVLQGFGSAVPNTNENFTDGRYRTYHGRALIAVRAGYEPGEIKVTVKGEGLRDRETKISVVGTL